MTRKIIASVALVGTLSLGAAGAMDFNYNGYVGAFGNIGFGNGNKVNYGDSINQSSYAGVSGHFAGDFGFDNIHLGVGALAAFSPFNRNSIVGTKGYSLDNIYQKPFIDLSDLYFKYDTKEFKLVLGRYDVNDVLNTSDWIGGYNQGIAFNYQGQYFGIWGTYINDWLNTGYNLSPDFNSDFGKFGSGLSAFSPYNTTLGRFGNFFSRNVFSGGLDFNIADMVSINPYGAYWMNQGVNGAPLAQAGLRASLMLGDKSSFMSTTTFRTLWQNSIGIDNDFGMMYWIDQEFKFMDMFKLGAGYLYIGRKGVVSLNDRTRFYGQFFSPVGLNGNTLTRSYLNAGVSTWYVFGGFMITKTLNLDLLYAGGNYHEASAVLNWQIINDNQFNWSVGTGVVATGFNAANKLNVLAFTKFKF
ncbi:hypothetical protein BKH43_04350 [Helicobacter sp. 13S00401-1]|uniref:hypothetical protein n=1 Tax=Helicobacter sp. 13S00401-1 TaxID=1905758 RepID=UPI000BA546A1|nr:hypothetical protein [Helicobacter sp. 13S00401-1]PAF50793.1 hypothetical protein BKH43_04350 [Helicobacter sp. 13S00401-1]